MKLVRATAALAVPALALAGLVATTPAAPAHADTQLTQLQNFYSANDASKGWVDDLYNAVRAVGTPTYSRFGLTPAERTIQIRSANWVTIDSLGVVSLSRRSGPGFSLPRGRVHFLPSLAATETPRRLCSCNATVRAW